MKLRRAHWVWWVSMGVLAAATCTAASSPASKPAAALDAPQPGLRLITQEQYGHTIANLFGADIKIPLRLPPLRRVNGLQTVGASATEMTPGAFEQFENSARVIATQVVSEPRRRFTFSCRPAALDRPDDKCARQFLGETGRLLFRRALTREQLDDYVVLARQEAVATKDFYQGVAFALSGLLVSPRFLLIADVIEPVPGDPERVRLDGYSIATRLSLLLWNSFPDGELLSAAASGKLHDRRELLQQVDRMLASPLLESGMRAFFADMLMFDAFAVLSKDQIIYPGFSKQAVLDAREETLQTIVEQLIAKNHDYRDLFTMRETRVTGSLAALYRVPATDPGGWNEYTFRDDEQRGGLLTQVSFLALHGPPGRSSPTVRGKALREIFLCQRVPDPPPNVDFSLLNEAEGHVKTARERLQIHATNPVCAGCHKITDPMGLGLENFDGVGQYRLTEHGAPIDASGVLDGRKFSNARELGEALREHPKVVDCLVNRLYSYGVGRQVGKQDREPLAELQKGFAEDGYRVKSLLRGIAASEAFFSVSAPGPTAAVPDAVASAR